MKWVGGKTRLLPQLLARAPQRFERYFEPFAGGAALFFALRPARAVLGDANADLIATYEQVAFNVEPIIDVLHWHEAKHSRTHYYATRDWWNSHRGTEAQRAAAFLYLNRVCFNGLWRVNRKGEFNVPMGAYKNPTICDAEKLRAASRALQGVRLGVADYRDCLHDAKAGDFVYLDPPYDDTFNAYTPDAFNQRTLALFFRELVERGCSVMLSNSATPLIRELYADFTVEVVRSPRSVNSDAAGRGDVDELLITASTKETIAMPTQTEIPGTEPPDEIQAVKDAIGEWLDAKEQQRRAAEATKTKHQSIVALYAEHGIEHHAYTCPKTGKPKRLWLEKAPKAKSVAISVTKPKTKRKRGGADRDADAEIPEDNVIEMRRVPRSTVEKEIDGFGSVRERMEHKAEENADKAKRKGKS